MPIYEFYCPDCNIIFNFFSRKVDTSTIPACPKCERSRLERQVSMFATIGKATEEEDQLAGLDENRMEQALESLMRDSERISEDDPRQMASLMRRFTEKTGISLGDTMEEAIARMEKGEDPDQIEQDMGELLGDDEDLSFEAIKKKISGTRAQPRHDETLYQLSPGTESSVGSSEKG